MLKWLPDDRKSFKIGLVVVI